MAKKKIIAKTYHCDGYYNPSVCQFRGSPDAADIRYRKDNLAEPRRVCMNFGLDKKSNLCRHCVENRKYFRATPKRRANQKVSLTPYHAKDNDAKTVRAFSKAQHLIDYLLQNPSLYGVDVNTCQMISAKAVEVPK